MKKILFTAVASLGLFSAAMAKPDAPKTSTSSTVSFENTSVVKTDKGVKCSITVTVRNSRGAIVSSETFVLYGNGGCDTFFESIRNMYRMEGYYMAGPAK